MKRDTVILFCPSPWPGEARARVPYPLLYLERMIRDLPVRIILIDEQVESDYERTIEPYRDRLLLAGVSAMTGHQLVGGIKFSRYVKEVSPSCQIVWGGWHATLLPAQTLQEDYVDMVVVGQGEDVFREITTCLLAGESVESLSGLALQRDGELVLNPRRELVDINAFPRVNYGLLDLSHYVYRTAYSERCISYFASHGCPYRCAFCCTAEVYGRRWYAKTISTIIEDLQYLKQTAHVDSVTFDDDLFFAKKSFALDLCRAMIAADLNLTWDTLAHAALFNRSFSDEDVALLYRAGCRLLYVGAESGDPEVLSLIGKRSDVGDFLQFVRTLADHQITTHAFFMVCFPVDPDKDVLATKKLIMETKLSYPSLRASLYFYTPYPGTELYDLALREGFVPPDDLGGWATHTMRKFIAPWWTRDYRWELEVFLNFFVPLSDKNYFRSAPRSVRPFAYVVNSLFFPFASMRLKHQRLEYPLEAVLFIKALALFNRVARTSFSLGIESYLESPAPRSAALPHRKIGASHLKTWWSR